MGYMIFDLIVLVLIVLGILERVNLKHRIIELEQKLKEKK